MRWEQLKLDGQKLKDRTLYVSKNTCTCTICGAPTNYVDYSTEHFVCSEECMNAEKQAIDAGAIKMVKYEGPTVECSAGIDCDDCEYCTLSGAFGDKTSCSRLDSSMAPVFRQAVETE